MKFLPLSTLFATILVAEPLQVGGSSSGEDEAKACVSLNFYPDAQCGGEPEIVSFPTFTEPGKSECYDDELFFAVKDQYCNMDTGNFHQIVYPTGTQCQDSNIKWYLKLFFPMNQTFTTDSCEKVGDGSYNLNSCILGPCSGPAGPDGEDSDEDSEETAARTDQLAVPLRGLKGDD